MDEETQVKIFRERISNRMRILLKCWTPDFVDDPTHAVLDVNLALIDYIEARMALANKLKLEDLNFMGLEYDDYTPEFINVGDPLNIGMSEDEMEECDDGYHLFPEKMQHYDGFDTTPMRPVMLMVMAGDPLPDADGRTHTEMRGGRIYWYGYHKHGDAGSRAETYSLYPKDLKEFREILGSDIHLSKVRQPQY